MGEAEAAAMPGTDAADKPIEAERPNRWRAFLSGLLLVLAGAAEVGLVIAGAVLGDRLAALDLSF